MAAARAPYACWSSSSSSSSSSGSSSRVHQMQHIPAELQPMPHPLSHFLYVPSIGAPKAQTVIFVIGEGISMDNIPRYVAALAPNFNIVVAYMGLLSTAFPHPLAALDAGVKAAGQQWPGAELNFLAAGDAVDAALVFAGSRHGGHTPLRSMLLMTPRTAAKAAKPTRDYNVPTFILTTTNDGPDVADAATGLLMALDSVIDPSALILGSAMVDGAPEQAALEFFLQPAAVIQGTPVEPQEEAAAARAKH